MLFVVVVGVGLLFIVCWCLFVFGGDVVGL